MGDAGTDGCARYCYGDTFPDTCTDLECDKCDECVQAPSYTFGCEDWCNEFICNHDGCGECEFCSGADGPACEDCASDADSRALA